MDYLIEIGKRAKDASMIMNLLNTETKNRGLKRVAEALVNESSKILKANREDVERQRRME